MILEKLIDYLRTELKNPDVDYLSAPAQLHGGFETTIYRFQLTGAQTEYAHPLVLRLYPEFYGTQNAIWECAIQNVLADKGFPVARVHFLCSDMSILGGAFYVMDYLPGKPLMFTNPDRVPELLGKTHAELHQLDPQPVIDTLKAQGLDTYGYSLDSSLDGLKNKASKHPWIEEGVNWLVYNRPLNPERLSICHGDFHGLNILVDEDVVTGVLDWPGFKVADPVFDVANTLVLTTIPAKHLSSSWEGLPPIDWGLAAQNYLSAYQSHRELDGTNLDYYQVRRCVMALIQGIEGQKVWQHPLIVNDLISFIHTITSIQITLPNQA
jgi:aminoglycoside phosphotransferase (APT) family kinase protein